MHVAMLVLVLLLGACDSSLPPDVRDSVLGIFAHKVAPPELGNATDREQGIAWYETGFDPAVGGRARVWVALPQREEPVPCLVWAPTAMGWQLGGRLGEEDREQMLLFARAGVAVVAHDVPGAWDDNATIEELGRELDRYMDDLGGLQTARTVLDFVQARLPGVDPDRVWAAGEGPAATLALFLAQRDRRVRAVVAFDPVTDMAGYVAGEDMRFLAQLRPALTHFLLARSPAAGLSKLACPVLLYHDSFSHGGNFAPLEQFYLRCLREQKDVTMVDTLDVDPAHAGYELRTRRALDWLKHLGGVS